VQSREQPQTTDANQPPTDSAAVKILESLHERVPEKSALQRAVILGSDSDASRISAVLVRLPPGHEFPLHTHPRSEDCFFVLSGAGEAFGPEQRVAISATTGVWIPAGVPHGLAAGPSGMLEIGFQSPPDPTAVPFDPRSTKASQHGMLVESITAHSSPPRASPAWRPAFRHRTSWQHLDPHSAVLDPPQRLQAVGDGYELVVVVVQGAIVIGDRGIRLEAFAVLQLAPGEAVECCVLEPSTMLLGIRAHVPL
jgi:quercetin dioxygenase-like cupin family protein